MAARKRKKTGGKTRTVYKYRKAPKKSTRRRSYRKNPDNPFKMILAALAGSIVVGKGLAMLPAGINATAKNAIAIGSGVALNMLKQTKKNDIARGIGLGMAVVGGKNLLQSHFPQLSGPDDLTPDEQQILLDYLSQTPPNPSDYITSPEQAEALLGGPVAFAGINDPQPDLMHGPVTFGAMGAFDANSFNQPTM